AAAPAAAAAQPEVASVAGGPGGRAAGDELVADRERITIDELQRLWRAGEPVVILDVRSERTWREDDRKGRGALRFPPDTAVRRAGEVGLSNQAWLVAYCA
ncbi:MAG: hypothetical protein ACREKI_03735, partial [Gemmatimonadota bacterium]